MRQYWKWLFLVLIAAVPFAMNGWAESAKTQAGNQAKAEAQAQVNQDQDQLSVTR